MPKKILNRVKRERFALIDTLLNHYGYVKRGPLIDFFELSPALVTKILAEYRELWPDNAVYDPQQKCYLKAMGFEYHCAAHEHDVFTDGTGDVD